MTKENDWLVAQLNNQTYTFSDFKKVGLTADNTQMLSKDEYKKNAYITNHDAFKNDQGEFDEAKFDKFYDIVSPTYQVFSGNQFEDKVFENLAYDPYNALRPYDAKIKDVTQGFEIKKVPNPLRQKTGISNLGIIDNPEISIREAAESSKVYNWEKQKFEDYTPNDTALFENLFNFGKSLFNPLVLAQYEEGETSIDPTTGETITHKKGEYKQNEDGNYYYETLDGRSTYGKEIRSIWDNITAEGTKANNYDFFDSDSLDKSSTGIIMKTAAQILPLFAPGVQVAYGYMLLGSNLAELLPNMYKASIGLFTDDNNPIDKSMNYLQGIGKSFNSSMSDAGKQRMLGLESLANIVSDVALQWAEQRAIMDLSNKVMGTEALISEYQTKATEEALQYAATKSATEGASALEMAQVIAQNKLAPILKARNRASANLALGYMATLQGLETYEDALEQGASKAQAAALAWGSVAGMYAVDKTGLGELFFPELKDVERQTEKKVLKNLAENGVNTAFLKDQVEKATNSPKGLAKLFAKAGEKSAKFWGDIRSNSTTIFEKIIAEGLEEVSEEAVTDLLKGTNNLLIDMGMFSQAKKLDAFDNALERYGMNFLGGAIGGAIFAGVDLHQNNKNPEQLNQELIYMIRNGKKQDLIDELDHMYKAGTLGDSNLSARNGKNNSDNTGVVWESGTASDNQNLAAYNIIKGYINSLDQAIYQDGLNLSDEQLLDKMVMGDLRMKYLLSHGQSETNKFGVLMKDGYMGTMLQDWNTKCSEILKKEGKIQQLEHLSDTEKREDPEYDTKLANLKTEKAKLLAERDKFLDGTYAPHYVDELLFCMDPSVNQYFTSSTFQNYVEYKTGQEYAKVAENQVKLDELKTQYQAYLGNELKAKLQESHKIYQYFNKRLTSDLGSQNEKYLKYQELRKGLDEGLINKRRLIETIVALNWKGFNTFVQSLTGQEVKNITNQEELDRLKVTFVAMNQWDSDMSETNMDQVGAALKDKNGNYTLNSDATFEYTFQEQPFYLTKEEEEAGDVQKAIQNRDEHNKKVLNNYRNLVQQLVSTGYIDDEVKELVLKHIEYDKHLNLNLQNLRRYAQSYGFNTDLFNSSNDYDALITYIKNQIQEEKNKTYSVQEDENSITNLNNAFQSIIELNDTAFGTVGTPFTLESLANALSLQLGEDDPDSYMDMLLGTEGFTPNDAIMNTLETAFGINAQLSPKEAIPILVQNQDESIEINKELPKILRQLSISEKETVLENYERTYKTDENIKLGEQVKRITADPLTGMLKKLSIDTFGKPLTIIDILQRESGNLEKSQDITDFALSPDSDQQISQVGTLLDMVAAVVTASSTDKQNFGHNAVINEFIQKYAPTEQLYAVIGSDSAAEILSSIADYKRKLAVIKQISDINGVNSFAEQQKSGRQAIRLLSNGMLDKLKYFKYKGMSLLDGIDSINMESLLDPDNNENYIIAGQLESLIHKNFIKMLRACPDSDPLETVLRELFTPADNPTLLKTIFDKDGISIINGESSRLQGSITEITANDQLMWLGAILSQDRAEFEQALYSVLNKQNKKIAPLISQLIPVRIAVANYKQSKIFQTLLGIFKGDNQLSNTTIMPGIGGAGKTSVVAYLTKEIIQTLKPGSSINIIKVGPTDVQTKNLTEALGEDGKEMTIEELMRKILGPNYDLIQQAIEIGDESQFKISGNLVTVPRLNDYVGFSGEEVDAIFIDEATFVNTVFAKHLAYAAEKYGFHIFLTGDNYQNGYSKKITKKDGTEVHLGNIAPKNIGAVRTPNLSVSMRAQNIQKFNNVKDMLTQMSKFDNTLIHLNLIRKAIKDQGLSYNDALSKTINDSLDETLKAWQQFYSNYEIHYFEDDNKTITGEKIVNSIDKDVLRNILETTDSTIGLIYDDPSSETYKIFEEFRNNNLYKDRVKLYTQDQVQGSELDYFVVDLDLHPSLLKGSSVAPSAIKQFANNWYTIITRSKKGTWIKNNGLTSLFSPDFNKKDKTTTQTPSKDKLIQKYIDYFLKMQEKSMQVNPYTKEDKKNDLDPNGKTEEAFNKEVNVKESSAVHTVKPGDSAYSGIMGNYIAPIGLLPAPSSNIGELEGKEREQAEKEALEVVNQLGDLSKITQENQRLDTPTDPKTHLYVEDLEDTEGVIQHLPVYGSYFRLGCEVLKGEKENKYARIVEKDAEGNSILTDFNIYLPGRNEDTPINSLENVQTLTDGARGTTFNKRLNQLIALRQIIQSGILNIASEEKLKDPTFKERIKEITGFSVETLTQGRFLIKVKEYNPNIDEGYKMLDFKADAAKNTHATLVYRFQTGDTIQEVTLGALADPDTHLDYVKKLNSRTDGPYQYSKIKEDNAIEYKKVYKQWLNQAGVGTNTKKTLYHELPQSAFGRVHASHFKTEIDGQTQQGKDKRKKYVITDLSEVMPGTEISDPFIYADNDEDLTNFLKQAGVNTKGLKGKTIAFATAYPEVLKLIDSDYMNNIVAWFKKQLSSIESESNEWENQLFKESPLIRVVILDPKSIYSFQTSDVEYQQNRDKLRSQSGYFDPKWSEFGQGEAFDKSASAGIFRVPRTTNAKILTGLWNFRHDIIELKKIICGIKGWGLDSFSKNMQELAKNKAQLLELEKLVNTRIRKGAADGEFVPYFQIFVEEKVSKNLSGEAYDAASTRFFANPDQKDSFESLYQGKKKIVYPWLINPIAIDAIEATLNQFIDPIIKFVPAFDITNAGTSKSLQELNEDKSINWRIGTADSEKLATAINQEINTPCSLVAEGKDTDGNPIEPVKINFGLTGADKVQTILSQLLRVATMKAKTAKQFQITLYGKQVKNDETGEYDFADVVKGEEANPIPVLNLEGGFIENLAEIFQNNKTLQISFIEHLFNLILHGRNNPLYSGEFAGKTATNALFPRGFDVKSVYRPHQQGAPVAGFHRTINDKNDYVMDIGVESGVMTLSFPLTSNLKVQNEFTREQNISKVRQQLINDLGLINIESIVDEAINELSLDLVRLDQIKKNLLNSVSSKIHELLQNGNFNIKTSEGKTLLAYKHNVRGTFYHTFEDLFNISGNYEIITSSGEDGIKVVVKQGTHEWELDEKTFKQLHNRGDKTWNNSVNITNRNYIQVELSIQPNKDDIVKNLEQLRKLRPDLTEVINQILNEISENPTEENLKEIIEVINKQPNTENVQLNINKDEQEKDIRECFGGEGQDRMDNVDEDEWTANI